MKSFNMSGHNPVADSTTVTPMSIHPQSQHRLCPATLLKAQTYSPAILVQKQFLLQVST